MILLKRLEDDEYKINSLLLIFLTLDKAEELEIFSRFIFCSSIFLMRNIPSSLWIKISLSRVNML